MMKFFVSMFLLILSLFSFVKIVLSIKCHTSENPFEDQCWKEYDRSDKNEESKSRLFACFKNATKEENGSACPTYLTATACYTLTYECKYDIMKDQTQHMVKHCDDSKHNECEAMKREHEFKTWRFVTSLHCDFCSSDNCNDQKPKDKHSLSSKEKNSGALSGVTAPPAAAVFIIFSTIHILL